MSNEMLLAKGTLLYLPIKSSYTDVGHYGFDRRSKRRVKFLRCLRFEIVGRRRVAAVENFARVVESHLADRIPEDFLGERRSLFRGAIHTYDKLVDLRAIANQTKRLLYRL